MASTGIVPDVPNPEPPGALASANRVFKGLDTPSEGRTPREAALVFDQPVAGVEWYATERDPQGRPFRWSGPMTRSTAVLRVDTRADLVVDLRVLGAIAPDILDGLGLDVHGHEVPLRSTVPSDGGRRFSGVIPQKVAAAGEPDRVALDVHVPRTISPRDVDPASADVRPVGVALSWLSLRRATHEGNVDAPESERKDASSARGRLKRFVRRGEATL